jgi:hypothetical protein
MLKVANLLNHDPARFGFRTCEMHSGGSTGEDVIGRSAVDEVSYLGRKLAFPAPPGAGNEIGMRQAISPLSGS